MNEYLVKRPFFDLGTKFYPGEVITLTDPQRIANLTEQGIIVPVPTSVKSEPPVTSTTIVTNTK